MITLENVTKTYNAGKANAFTALEGIDCRISPRRVTVIEGPSGSGKTTLLSLIGCMARPSSGRIWHNGRETTSLLERFTAEIRRSDFGFIFQNYNLIRGLSALENIMLPAYPNGEPYAALKQRAVGLLEQFGIAARQRENVERLSGGEQQRVAISRALINRPGTLIADEPTAHLDTELAQAFLSVVADLKAGGKTILMASHDPLVCDAPVVDDRITLRDGRIADSEART
jgi:putative ABC transport system ATP-binding protein